MSDDPLVLTPEQEAAVKYWQAAYPYRIVYVATHPTTGEFVCSAVLSMRIPNRLAREGWTVAKIVR